MPGVEQVVAFGTALHVSGSDDALLRASLEPFMNSEHEWQQVPSGLEEVFISLMGEGRDNFS